MKVRKDDLPDETPELAAGVPAHLLKALRLYAIERRETGRFLRAVLENDLQTAIGLADPESFASIKGICEYVYGALPCDCWGSKAKVQAWLERSEA